MFFAVKEKSIFDAHELYLSGKYDKALSLCEQLLAHNSDSYSAINLIANIYFISGNFAKGEHYIYKLRDYFIRKNQYDKSVAILERLHLMRPSSPKYLIDIAEVYKDKQDCHSYIRTVIKLGELYRKNGQFQEAGEAYLNAVEHLKDNPNSVIALVNKLAVIGGHDKIGLITKNIVLPRDNFSLPQKDDITLLCAESGCDAEYYISFIPSFLSRGKGRYGLIEEHMYNYFIQNKNDELFLWILDIAPEAETLIGRVREAAPQNVPDLSTPESAIPIINEAVIVTDRIESDEDAAVESIEIETHIEQSDSSFEVTALELDSYQKDSDETAVTMEINDLESTYVKSEKTSEAVAVEGFETYDILSSFDVPDTSIDDKLAKSFYDLEDLLTPEPLIEKTTVEQIDMSDVEIVQSENADMFEGLIEEKDEKTTAQKPEKKISIDMNEIKSNNSKDKDIFDMEV